MTEQHPVPVALLWHGRLFTIDATVEQWTDEGRPCRRVVAYGGRGTSAVFDLVLDVDGWRLL